MHINSLHVWTPPKYFSDRSKTRIISEIRYLAIQIQQLLIVLTIFVFTPPNQFTKIAGMFCHVTSIYSDFSHDVCLPEEPAIYKFLLFKKATETMTGCELSFSWVNWDPYSRPLLYCTGRIPTYFYLMTLESRKIV